MKSTVIFLILSLNLSLFAMEEGLAKLRLDDNYDSTEDVRISKKSDARLFAEKFVKGEVLNLRLANIISNDVAAYYADDIEAKTIASVIKDVENMKLAERNNINTLNLSTNSIEDSLPEIIERLLPLFPALQQLDLSCSGIGKDKLPAIITLLKKYPSLKYIDIKGNMLADALLQMILDEANNNKVYGENFIALKKQIIQKVIIETRSVLNLKNIKIKKIPEWVDTHLNFYQNNKNSFEN